MKHKYSLRSRSGRGGSIWAERVELGPWQGVGVRGDLTDELLDRACPSFEGAAGSADDAAGRALQCQVPTERRIIASTGQQHACVHGVTKLLSPSLAGCST